MKQSKTQQLEELRQIEVQRRARSRELGLEADTAIKGVADARTKLVQATAAGEARAISKAEKARAEATAHADRAAIDSEAAELNVVTAERDRQTFERGHAADLIAELEPAAREVVAKLTSAAKSLVEADRTWFQVYQRVSELVAGVPNAGPADLPSTHALAEMARVLRKSDLEVVPPLPHWRGRDQVDAEQRTVKALKAAKAERRGDTEMGVLS